MKERNEKITVLTTIGNHETEAIIRGDFAIHKTIVARHRELPLYTVTHIPTKLALMHKLETLDDARALIGELYSVNINWAAITEAPSSKNYLQYMNKTAYMKIGRIIRHYRKHISRMDWCD
jgi:hypothetical protein